MTADVGRVIAHWIMSESDRWDLDDGGDEAAADLLTTLEKNGFTLAAASRAASAPGGFDRETIQTLLDLLNPIHGSIDKQTYDELMREELEVPRDRELNVNITVQMERDLTQAVLILEDRKRQAKAASAPWQLIPKEPTRDWINNLAHARQGQSLYPRCEQPDPYEINRARATIAEVLAASPTPSRSPAPVECCGAWKSEGEGVFCERCPERTKIADQYNEVSPAPADAAVETLRLRTIAGIIRSWLDWHKAQRDVAHLATVGDTHIMALPVPFWPTHDAMENWIATLINAAEALSAPQPAGNEALAQADAVCDSYAEENQRISDERDTLRAELDRCREALRAEALEEAATIAQHLSGWGHPPCPELAEHIAKTIRAHAALAPKDRADG